MKKKLFSLILCLLLLPVLMVQAKTALVNDFAGLLDSQQEAELEALAASFRDSHGMDVAILTTSTITGAASAESFADDFFERNYGENGILFLVDMESRSWHFSTCGTAVTLLSDSDLIDLEDAVLYKLSNGRYYDSFQAYLTALPGLLEPESEGSFLSFLLIAAVPGAILAAIVLAVMASLMNSKKPQHSAADYTVKGSYKLRTQQDLFLYSNLSKRAKSKENKSGSTTHTSSSGRTHGGRGGKF